MNNEKIYFTEMDSPLGKILLAGSSRGLRTINFQESSVRLTPNPYWQEDQGRFQQAIFQMNAYFEGKVTEFELELDPKGTPFDQKVWDALKEIPYGETTSYGSIAARIDMPMAARAVGAANGRNPLPVVVPCHRVIGSDGSLRGYAGGIRFKQALLEIEREHMPAKTGEQIRLF